MTNHGFILINKPQDWTSFDVVAKMRGITGIRKIGHAGTLDPFATGLLIVAIGRGATKQIDSLVGLDKEYIADFVIGATTESFDTETEVTVDANMPEISHKQIETAMKELTGEIEQIPPMHSAIKIGGKRLYKMARKGEEIERKARAVRIYDFELIDKIQENNKGHIIKVRIKCSSGTYIRAIARDLAQKLGTTGYCRELHRTKIGNFDVNDANEMSDLNSENWESYLIDNPTE